MPDKESKLSRRSLLRGGAIAGALGVGLAMTGGTSALAAALPKGSHGSSPEPGGPTYGSSQGIVIYLADPRSGELDVFAGTTRTHLTNRSLAAAVASVAPRS